MNASPDVILHPKITLRTLFVLVTCAAGLFGILLPLIQRSREAARRMQCTNNLRQLMLGVHNYESAYKKVPTAFQQHSGLNWTVSMYPFLEASSLYSSITHSAGPYYAPGKNDPFGLTKLSIFHCPSSPVNRMELNPPSDVSLADLVPINTGEAPYTIHYYGISGPLEQQPNGSQLYPLASPLTFEDTPVAGSGMIQWNSAVRFDDITDGLSNTTCFGEMSWVSRKFGTRYRSWMHGGTDGSYLAGCRNIARPINSHRHGAVIFPFSNMPMGSQHWGGALFGIGDGRVEFLTQEIDFSVYKAWATKAGGETIESE